MIKTKNISEMLTSLIEEYRFNKNTLSKYLEITEETIDGVVMGNVECLPDVNCPLCQGHFELV